MRVRILPYLVFVILTSFTGCVRGLPKDTLYAFYVENKTFLEEKGIDLKEIAKPDGTVFLEKATINPLGFRSTLEKEIAFQIQSKSMGAVFEDVVTKVFASDQITEAQREALRPLVVHYASFFFSDGSSQKLLAQHLAREVPDMDVPKLEGLFKKVHVLLREKYPRVSGLTKNVMILTGPYGGGHESAAAAFKEAFEPEITSEVVQTCDFEGKGLFYKIYGRETKSCELIKKVHLGKSDFELFFVLRSMYFTLKNYELQDTWMKLIEEIRAKKPGLLVSTIHHIREVSFIALVTGIPLRIFVTDFENPHAQSDLINFYDPDEVKLWLPSESSIQLHAFHNFFDRKPEARNYGRTKIISEILSQNAETWVDRKDALEVFSLMPFPVLKAFTNRIDKKKARANLGLGPYIGQKTVSLMYGSSGSGQVPLNALESLFKVHRKENEKLEVLFLSSGNRELKQGAKEVFEKYHVGSSEEIGKKSLVGHIFDKLDLAKDMPSVYFVSDAVYTKPGGATAAEILATKTPMLPMLPPFSWEIGNYHFLQSVGLTLNFEVEREALTPEELRNMLDALFKGLPVKNEKIPYFKRDQLQKEVQSILSKHKGAQP